MCAVLVFAAAPIGTAAESEPATKIRALKPEADTYVTAAEPDRNFGRAALLRADSEPEVTTYVRFRLQKLVEKKLSVTLLLYPRAGARTGFEVREAQHSGWREGRLTYATAPRLSLRYASSKPVQRGAWSAVDVTRFIGESGEVSLAITTRSPFGVAFRSRESSQGPRLVVRTG